MRPKSRQVLILTAALIVVAVTVHGPGSDASPSTAYRVLPYPDGKLFALSLEDDSDGGDLERIAPVYALLDELRIPVTRAVWMFPAEAENGEIRYTLADPAMRAFVLELARHGHEIALHGVTAGHDTREMIVRGFDAYRELFGHDPAMHIDHSKNLENMYFGKYRLDSPVARALYSVFDATDYQGHQQGTSYFWGDLARDRVTYHRGWYVTKLNTLAVNPSMPDHDPEKPYVRYWHAVTDALNADRFVNVMTPDAVARLKAEHGATILYTHLGFGFYDRKAGRVREDVRAIFASLAAEPSLWIVPASELLDRLRLVRQVGIQQFENAIVLYNTTDQAVRGLTMVGMPLGAPAVRCRTGCSIRTVGNALVVDSLPRYSVTILDAGGRRAERHPGAGSIERIRCVAHWLWRSIAIRI